MTSVHPLLPLLVAVLMLEAPRAHAATGEATQDLRMAADSAPFRDAADALVAHAMAGDMDATQLMLSRQLVGRIGGTAARQLLQAQILPFFQRGRQSGGPVTVTQTTDASGQPGFAFYMWMQSAQTSRARPFTSYVVKEQGRPAIANIVLNRLVEGRHR